LKQTLAEEVGAKVGWSNDTKHNAQARNNDPGWAQKERTGLKERIWNTPPSQKLSVENVSRKQDDALDLLC